MSHEAATIRLELPRVEGAAEFLTELGRLIDLQFERSSEVFRLGGRRPPNSSPDFEISLVEGGGVRLCCVNGGRSEPLGFSFEPRAGESEADSPARTRTGAHAVGTRHTIAPGTPAMAQDLTAIREILAGAISGVDHLGLNLPAGANPIPDWHAGLRDLAGKTSPTGVLPYDKNSEICFVVPTTAAEREAGALDSGVVRKPKLELVRDQHLARPMIGFAIDTELSLDDLHNRFPAPLGASRPGDEVFFRSVLLANPWEDLLFLLDLNSSVTSTIEITQILVDGGHRLSDADAGEFNEG